MFPDTGTPRPESLNPGGGRLDKGGAANSPFHRQSDLVVGDDGFIPDVWILTSDDGEVCRFTTDRSIVVSDDGVTVSGVRDDGLATYDLPLQEFLAALDG